MEDRYKLIAAALGEERVKYDERLIHHTYTKLKSRAEIFYIATTLKELIAVLDLAYELKIPYLVLGAGTKYLTKRADIKGLVIKNRTTQIKIGAIKGKVSTSGLGIEEAQIEVDSGVSINKLNDFLYDNIKFSSYTGISLDVLMGLIYICKKFNTVQTTLTKNFMKNQILEDYYSANGIQKGLYDDFLNFELIWSYQKLFFPTTLKTTIHDFLKNNNKRFLIIPIGIELTVGAHANILLYDKINNEMERFEPYGKDFPPGFNYNPSGLDNNLKNYFKNYFDIDNNLLITRELDGSNNTNGKKPFKYITPFEYELKIGFQTLDTLEYSKEKYIGDPGGFCEVWSLWYVEMRLTNLNIERKDIIYKLINYIRSKQISFRSIIRGFTKNITDIRDEYLLKVGLDINKWLNENYTKEQWENLINLIKNDIKNDV